MKTFVTKEEAAKDLGVPVSEVTRLAEDGTFSLFKIKDDKNNDIVLFKKNQVAEYKDSTEYKELVKNNVVVHQKDHYGTITLCLFSFCGIVFLFSIFARRPYLLEFLVPPLALVGLIFLGLSLLKHHKEKEQKIKAEKTAEETDRLLNQIDRLQKQSEKR